MNQSQKALIFRDLHEQPGTFVIPNPWDAGSARLLASVGFKALATTSAGFAFSIGHRDGAVTRDETLANARSIVDATDLPVSADLENGFGDDPREAAATILKAAEAGLVGGSIEDATGNPARPIYDFQHAVERVAAAAEAARSLPFPFMLVARAENFLVGRADLNDTIRRLHAFEKAGANVLYAPSLPNIEAVRAVCSAVSKPLNVLAGGPEFTVAELSEAGVRRISVGGAFARAALGGLMRAAREVQERGTFTFGQDALPFSAVQAVMRPRNTT